MITSTDELRQSIEQLGSAYQAVATLRAEHPTASREWLAVMAEGFLDHARQIQAEIDDYLGLAEISFPSDPDEGPLGAARPEVETVSS